MECKVVNLVATASIMYRLRLQVLYESFLKKGKNVKYNPRNFIALIFRIPDPKTGFLIFPNGKIVINGSKSFDHCKKAVAEIEKILCKELGLSVSLRNVTIHNVVGSVDVKFLIDVKKLCVSYKSQTIYTPELFPGLKFQIHSPKLCALIFHSGKIVLTGAKSVMEVEKGAQIIYDVVGKFQKIL
jgi:transcription initiation factor TFIID TATA-box-binding protein